MKEAWPKLTTDGTQWVWPDGKKLPRVRGGSDVPPGSDPAGGATLTDPSLNGGDPRNSFPQNQPPSTLPPGVYTEEQLRERLNQARSEERDKLYGSRAQEMQELAELRAFRENQEKLRQEQEAEQQRLADEQRRQQENEELSAKDLIARREAEIRAEMEAQRAYYDQQLAQRDALLAKEREFAELSAYAERVKAANGDNILPEFIDMVQGNSREEIDRSVEDLINRTQRVLQNMQGVQQEQFRQAPGVSTRAPAVGPESMVGGQRNFSAEEIAQWSMGDYMKYREQLPPGRAGGSDRGLF
jgi:hypothetical protein